MQNSKNSAGTGEGLNLENGTPAESQSAETPQETPAETDGAGTGNGQEGKPAKKDPDLEKLEKTKIGLATFVRVAEPNKYVIAMLKNKRGMEVHTRAEWQQIVDDLLKQKVS